MDGEEPEDSNGSGTSDEDDWDNLEEWGEEGEEGEEGGNNAGAGGVSPTASWDDGDEPWDNIAGRGVGAPRSPQDVATARPQAAPPPMEGVLSPGAREHVVAESFGWGSQEAWNSGEASTSSSRGLGRPRTEAERLEELRRQGHRLEDVQELGSEWANVQEWVVNPRGPTPPPMEGVLSPSAAQHGVAMGINLGSDGDGIGMPQRGQHPQHPQPSQQRPPRTPPSASRGVGQPRSEAERLELLRTERAGNLPPGVVAMSGDDGWARSAGPTLSPAERQRLAPEGEGVLAVGMREDGAFAETFNWGDGRGEAEWAQTEENVVQRGAGVPMHPTVRRQQQQRLHLTTYERELLQQQLPEGVGFPGDWSINLPRGEAVRRGDEVEEWARVMAPTGPLPAIHPGNMLEPERDVEKDSNATPSSFNSDKKFNLIKEISTRFLPDFASDENRALNIMVQEAERALRDVEDAVQEQDDRTAVMEDHMKRVQEEIAATQLRVEAKRREIASEEHLKILTTFQAARLKREVTKMENEMHDMMERLRNFSATILQGNDKLDKIRLVQQWNEQELEQWVQAAMQKDEDIVALTSYAKHDTTRITALRLEEKTASGELASLEDMLEIEMSETQSYQIQLDRTAEEFRRLHVERQKVIQMWEEAIELVHQRDLEIQRYSDEFARHKGALRNGKRSLDALDLKLYNAVEKNKDLERAIHLKNIDAQRQRDTLRLEIESCARTREELVLVRTNYMRAQHRFAQETAKKIYFQEEIVRQKNMLNDARQKLEKMKKMVEEEYNHLDTLEKRTNALEKLLDTEELNLKLAKKEVVELQERHFRASEKLFSIKAAESDTEHEIKSGKTQAKTLLAKIAILEMDMLKKEEKLYNADFQIQLMEGKVGRASGERRPDEEQATTKQIKDLETQLAQVQQEEVAIIAQLKKANDTMRASIQHKDELEKKNRKLIDKNAELNLECDSGLVGNKALIKEKEEIALEADLLLMEVNRLTDLLHSKADEVFSLDRLKQRLQKNMEDRRAEVDARQEIQRREMKLIGEELHGLTVKRQNLLLNIDRLVCKYGNLRARMQSADGVEITAEFFLNKLKTDREEVQSRGAELHQELKKAKVDVEFLEKATAQLVQSNNNLRTSLAESERKFELEEEAKVLKEDLGKSRDQARFKEREERSLLQDLAEVEARVEDIEKECATATKTYENLEMKIELAHKDETEQVAKRKRAAARLNTLMCQLRENLPPEETTRLGGEFILAEMRESTKDVLYKLKQLAQDNPDYASAIEKRVAREGFKLPSGPANSRSSISGSSSAGSVTSKGSGQDGATSKGKSKVMQGAPSSVVKMEFKGT